MLDTSTLLYKVCTNVVQQTLLFQNTVTRQNSHKRIFLQKFRDNCTVGPCGMS
jgi:hypothetical protein